MTRRGRILAPAVFSLLPLLGTNCLPVATPVLADRPSCAAGSARGVVRAYYRALNRHDAAGAMACLTPRSRREAESAIDPDWENVISAQVRSLMARRVPDSLLPPEVTPAPYRAVQVFAEVEMRYRRIGGAPNGLDPWFIYVIRQTRTSPWRIAGIGTGP